MVGCSFSSKLVVGQEKHSGDECHTLAPIFRLNTISPQIFFAWNAEVTDGAIPLAIFRWQYSVGKYKRHQKRRSVQRAKFCNRLAIAVMIVFNRIYSQVFTRWRCRPRRYRKHHSIKPGREKQLATRHRSAQRRFWLFALAAFLFASSVFAAPVARAEFVIGNVFALAVDGRVRALVKGAALEEGDTVNTNEGRVQFRFTDDGFVSLYTRTVFRIDQYRWGGVNEGSERSFFSLVEGGVRTITGRLAKHNRTGYKMTTPLATVGVRGTQYTMQLNGGLSGSVAEGEIEVCNAGGCIAGPAGQAHFGPHANTKPFLSNKQAYLPPS